MKDLGKWPRLTLIGEPVTEEQASEIILRTTDWYELTCNNRRWEGQARKVAARYGWPAPPPYGTPQLEQQMAWYERSQQLIAFKRRWQVLDLDHLQNRQIMSRWFGGAHGWCSWDGWIGANTYNLGKWPTHGEVLEELETVAGAFPFLNMRAQLWPDEGKELPVVEYVVAGGVVTCSDPIGEPITPGDPWAAVNEGRRAGRTREGLGQGTDSDQLDLAFRQAAVRIFTNKESDAC